MIRRRCCRDESIHWTTLTFRHCNSRRECFDVMLMAREEGARIGDRPGKARNGGVYLLAFATGLLGHDAGTRF